MDWQAKWKKAKIMKKLWSKSCLYKEAQWDVKLGWKLHNFDVLTECDEAFFIVANENNEDK